FDHSLGSYVEDWDMWLSIAKHSPFAVIKEPLSITASMLIAVQPTGKRWRRATPKSLRKLSPLRHHSS
ncbi:MAG: hypothetical protein AAF050_14930, partial [Cyanobacteria bacterium J06649_5]